MCTFFGDIESCWDEIQDNVCGSSAGVERRNMHQQSFHILQLSFDSLYGEEEEAQEGDSEIHGSRVRNEMNRGQSGVES